MTPKITTILKEELLNQTITGIEDYVNKFNTHNIIIYDDSLNEVDYLFFAFTEYTHLDGYKDEINRFSEILGEYFSKLKEDENLLVRKKFEDRIIYLGKGFNEEKELIDYCKQHKLGDYIDVESGKVEDIKKLDDTFDLNHTKDDVTFPPELLSKLTLHNGLVKLYHYGSDKLENGVLDPKFYKTNPITSDNSGQPKVFFYIKKEDKERIVSGTEYTVEVPLKDLYPFNSDPFYLYNKAVKEYGKEQIPVAYQISYITQYVMDLGFKGMISKWNNTYRVDYYYPIKPIQIK